MHQYYGNGIIMILFTPLLLFLLMDQLAVSLALTNKLSVEPLPRTPGVVSVFELRTGICTASLEFGKMPVLLAKGRETHGGLPGS